MSRHDNVVVCLHASSLRKVFYVCFLSVLVRAGDPVQTHLERQPEQPALLLQSGAAGPRHHPPGLQDPGLSEGYPAEQAAPQHQHQLQGGQYRQPVRAGFLSSPPPHVFFVGLFCLFLVARNQKVVRVCVCVFCQCPVFRVLNHAFFFFFARG